jgi:hypothetical protein
VYSPVTRSVYLFTGSTLELIMRHLAVAEVSAVSGGYWEDDGYGNTAWMDDTDKKGRGSGGRNSGSGGGSQMQNMEAGIKTVFGGIGTLWTIAANIDLSLTLGSAIDDLYNKYKPNNPSEVNGSNGSFDEIPGDAFAGASVGGNLGPLGGNDLPQGDQYGKLIRKT